jgi:hypothetical protein
MFELENSNQHLENIWQFQGDGTQPDGIVLKVLYTLKISQV